MTNLSMKSFDGMAHAWKLKTQGGFVGFGSMFVIHRDYSIEILDAFVVRITFMEFSSMNAITISLNTIQQNDSIFFSSLISKQK